jgi:hypothetical protein
VTDDADEFAFVDGKVNTIENGISTLRRIVNFGDVVDFEERRSS